MKKVLTKTFLFSLLLMLTSCTGQSPRVGCGYVWLIEGAWNEQYEIVPMPHGERRETCTNDWEPEGKLVLIGGKRYRVGCVRSGDNDEVIVMYVPGESERFFVELGDERIMMCKIDLGDST